MTTAEAFTRRVAQAIHDDRRDPERVAAWLALWIVCVCGEA